MLEAQPDRDHHPTSYTEAKGGLAPRVLEPRKCKAGGRGSGYVKVRWKGGLRVSGHN